MSAPWQEVTLPEQKTFDGKPFPLVLVPKENLPLPEWRQVLRDNKKELEVKDLIYC